MKYLCIFFVLLFIEVPVFALPEWSDNSTNISSTYDPTFSSEFNITWINNISTVFLEQNWTNPSGENLTMNNTTYGGSIYNYSVILPAGTYYWKSYANDTSNNQNSSDTWIFTISKADNPVNLYLNGTQNDNKTYIYPENVNATATATAGMVYLYRDGVHISNGTSSQSELILLGNGTYAYQVNATGNQNYTDNSTGVIFYALVNKGTPYTNLEVNETTVKKGNMINITAWASDLSLNTIIYANFTGNLTEVNNSAGVNTNITNTSNLALGFYNISANVTGNQNYTSNSTLETIVIGITDLNWTNNRTFPNSSSNYSLGRNYSFEIKWVGSISNVTFESNFNGTLLNYTNNTNVSNWNKTISIINDTSGNYWINFTDLPAGSYNYTWYANDINDIWIFNRWNYTINQLTITPTFAVSGSSTWTTTTSTSVTLVCTSTHPVNLTITGGSCAGTLDDNYTTCAFTTPSTQGSYDYTCTVDASGNYSGYNTGTLAYAPFSSSSSPSEGTTPVFEITPYITLAVGKVNITLSSTITTSSKMVADITKYEDIAIRQLNITVVNSVNKIKIMITKLASLPATVPHEIEGKVFHYINIEKINITDADVNTVAIKFAVNKTWLTENSVSDLNITLYRWNNNQWNDLSATKISEDSYEVFYSAVSPGLSIFSVGTKGGIPEETPVACVESWSCTDWSECLNETQTRTCTDANACGTTVDKPLESQSCGEVGEGGVVPVGFPIWSSIAIVIVIVVVIVLVFTQRAKVKPFINPFISKIKKKFKKKKEEKVQYVYKRPK